MTISDASGVWCGSSCKLFTLVDKHFTDKYALLSVLVIKLSQSMPCRIGITDGWVGLYVINDTDLTPFSHIMDRYIYVFQE